MFPDEFSAASEEPLPRLGGQTGRFLTNPARQMSSHYPVWEASYRPFGGEVNAQNVANNHKFTGFEPFRSPMTYPQDKRDAESGLDHT